MLRIYTVHSIEQLLSPGLRWLLNKFSARPPLLSVLLGCIYLSFHSQLCLLLYLRHPVTFSRLYDALFLFFTIS